MGNQAATVLQYYDEFKVKKKYLIIVVGLSCYRASEVLNALFLQFTIDSMAGNVEIRNFRYLGKQYSGPVYTLTYVITCHMSHY